MIYFRIGRVGLLGCLLCGCPGAAFKSAEQAESASADQPTAPEAGGDAPAQADQPDAEPPKQNALQREARLVDRSSYLQEHPNAVELEKNVINASDPLTASAQGYFAGVSSLMISAYEHDLRLQKALNDDKWPTYDAYKQILDTHGVKLKGLKKGQVYAYDDQTGQISILELPDEEAGT